MNTSQSPPAFSMGKGDERNKPVRKDRDLKNVGPGSYERTFADKKKDPNYSMGAKLTSSLVKRDAASSPEPGRYNPSTTLSKSKSPAFRIGTEQRSAGFDARKAKLVPGAGQYETKSAAFNIEKPKFHMGVRLDHDDTKKFIHSVPGPGTHSPTGVVGKSRAPVYSMGGKLKSSLTRNEYVPGPGQYVNSAERLKQSSPSFGFGTSQRPDIGGKKNMQVPGPGAYKLPSKIADVPDFAMPNRQGESKYV